jgi:hypothetical protein
MVILKQFNSFISMYDMVYLLVYPQGLQLHQGHLMDTKVVNEYMEGVITGDKCE